jgi:hypothetical protein
MPNTASKTEYSVLDSRILSKKMYNGKYHEKAFTTTMRTARKCFVRRLLCVTDVWVIFSCDSLLSIAYPINKIS